MAVASEEARQARARAAEALRAAGVVLTPEEAEHIEIADFGLGDLPRLGLQIVTYVNTERVCAKELVLFPRQTCPEHRHPPVPEFGDPGKEETFRCRAGLVYVYLPGGDRADPRGATLPAGHEAHFTAFREYALRPGEQLTIPPDTLHWFQAGDDGAVVSEFSTRSRDELDLFTDPAVIRAPAIAD
jgi:D-lyxose ketol-isomerase